ncbi:hypothetical protein AC578_4967 [Pseudocercospora eumusae]|uniref:Uncharacterized protein n=1 Tax=Pseudocercospora eumusae TaxID=321146 RepID=A0A139HNJ4_9PEZI|nr:hypothetical protein AC578_4967 [Pseudocercospora eumusae]
MFDGNNGSSRSRYQTFSAESIRMVDPLGITTGSELKLSPRVSITEKDAGVATPIASVDVDGIGGKPLHKAHLHKVRARNDAISNADVFQYKMSYSGQEAVEAQVLEMIGDCASGGSIFAFDEEEWQRLKLGGLSPSPYDN